MDVDQTTDAAEPLLRNDRLRCHAPLQGPLLDEDIETMVLHHHEGDGDHTFQADLGPLHAETMEETGTEEVVQDAVIETDP